MAGDAVRGDIDAAKAIVDVTPISSEVIGTAAGPAAVGVATLPSGKKVVVDAAPQTSAAGGSGGGGGHEPPGSYRVVMDEGEPGRPEVDLSELDDAMRRLKAEFDKIPEFVREDILEGVLVGSGVALPLMMVNGLSAEEKAAVLAGSIGGGIGIGAAGRRLGAWGGRMMHPDPLPDGAAHNLGRMMGRKSMADTAMDMLAMDERPVITGEHTGRAIGRMFGDEVGAIGGAVGGLMAARAMNGGQPMAEEPIGVGEVLMGAVPGAAISAGLSVGASGMLDIPGLYRSEFEQLRRGGY